ncbi:FAD-binding oxidoreductase [Streptomyces sp. NPDC102405]|uniref:FAD-binding oxidoreductase n=1 Tax=Streptomyces sp. NPDC102405 TaxID=3366170 RepID=UPI00380C16D8
MRPITAVSVEACRLRQIRHRRRTDCAQEADHDGAPAPPSRLPFHRSRPALPHRPADTLPGRPVPQRHPRRRRPRSSSPANAPQHNSLAQLHVRHELNGAFSARILQGLEFHDTVEMEAPLGEFFVEDRDGPILLLATGTGFAPRQSVILDHIARRPNRALHLYWGGRPLEDLYARTTIQAWTRRYPLVPVHPLLSRPHPVGKAPPVGYRQPRSRTTPT